MKIKMNPANRNLESFLNGNYFCKLEVSFAIKLSLDRLWKNGQFSEISIVKSDNIAYNIVG